MLLATQSQAQEKAEIVTSRLAARKQVERHKIPDTSKKRTCDGKEVVYTIPYLGQ